MSTRSYVRLIFAYSTALPSLMLRTPLFFALLFVTVLAAHLCHTRVLWEPETFPLAAATQMLNGHALYRDIWYDKPPLSPLLHLAIGAQAGWVLRVLGALYTLLCSGLAYGFARSLWGRREALWAAGMLAFFLTFDFPASVLPLGPDMLTIAPHLAAVWLAWRGRPFWAGTVAALATLANVKGVFVLLACVPFAWPGVLLGVPLLLLGFAVPCCLAAAALAGTGALPGFAEQVWLWSSLYAASPFLTNPLANGITRTANWAGFHAALLAASTWRIPWRFVLWIAISFLAVALGLRFFPRYYLQLLPPLCLTAAYGAARLRGRAWAAAALLVIPLIRFAPRYVTVAQNKPWADTALDRDSRQAARLLQPLTRAGDTLFIWGYRPELWVYSHLPDASRFLDSQPLTGVPADRHLTQSTPIDRERPARARQQLLRTNPTFIADGLSLYNPRLSLSAYPELRAWFAQYREVGRTEGTILYRRADTIVR
jgi:hypothetical protein